MKKSPLPTTPSKKTQHDKEEDEQLNNFDLQRPILELHQANAIKHHFTHINEHQHGFFHRIKYREIIGEDKLRIISNYQTLHTHAIQSIMKTFITANQHILNNPALLAPIHLTEHIETITRNIQKQNERVENQVHQQLTPYDFLLYWLYKMIAHNRFYKTGQSLFLAIEMASRDELLKHIPGNVPLSPTFVTIFSNVSGLLYLSSAVSQFGVLGFLCLSTLTHLTADLELLTWIGSTMYLSPETTLQTIANVGYDFSLKDITEFIVIITQVLMELSDQQNTTILRAITGSILIFLLAGTVAKVITGKMASPKHNQLTPLISICSFFAAMRVMTYAVHFVTTGCSFLYESDDHNTSEAILVNESLCAARPKQCNGAAFRFFNLSLNASRHEITHAYQEKTRLYHPDLSTGDTDGLLKTRTARKVLLLSFSQHQEKLPNRADEGRLNLKEQTPLLHNTPAN